MLTAPCISATGIMAAIRIYPEVVLVAEILLSGAFAVLLYRAIKGPDPTDRVVVLDLLTGVFLCVVMLHAVRSRNPAYLDVAIALAVISFAGTVALAQYLTWPIGPARHPSQFPPDQTDTQP